jgi:hypothetical protein
MAGIIVTGISLTLLAIFRFFDVEYTPFLAWEREQDTKTSVARKSALATQGGATNISKKGNEGTIIDLPIVKKYSFEAAKENDELSDIGTTPVNLDPNSGSSDDKLLDSKP